MTQAREPAWWRIPRAFEGEVVFVIGGGPSVAQADLAPLRGRRVIAINSSYETILARGLPCDLLVFGDVDWWADHCAQLTREWRGPIVTAGADVMHPRVFNLRNCRPDRAGARPPLEPLALSRDPGAVPLRRTTYAAALNIAWLGGARAIVCLGLDGRAASDGRTHHHTPHRKKATLSDRATQWCVQGDYDLGPLAAEFAALCFPVLNASPGSAHAFFPVVTLAQALALVDGAQRAAA